MTRTEGVSLLWEGGIRVPAIVRWPGRIPSGRVSGQVGMTMDLTASILAATNTSVPPEARLDGIDLFPVALRRLGAGPFTSAAYLRAHVGTYRPSVARPKQGTAVYWCVE